MSAGSPRVLIVEDEPEVRAMLREYLSMNRCEVQEADSGAGMRAALARSLPDIVLLDLGLPGEDGLALARHLREHHDLPIIMVTGADSVVDRVVGLEVGADDYVTKPFDLRELLARVKSVLRRYGRDAADEAQQRLDGAESGDRRCFGGCTLDLASHQLFGADGDPIPLTRMEYDLLKVLAERPNRVLSRDQLFNLTQNRDWNPFDRSLDIRIARLRRKIEPDHEHPSIIRTVRGRGYMLVSGRN